MNIPKSNELVSYSKAGDKFHYLWAVCRSLRMVYPKSPIHHMVIEGSDQPQLEGEYVIDVSEYIGPAEGDIQEIDHFQLKHTITQKEKPFQLSNTDIKKTISGFAKRYLGYLNHNGKNNVSPIIRFSIITNRPIDQSLKQGIENIIRGNPVDTRFLNTLKRYTKLDGENLTKFCSSLNFVDGEGDYSIQRYKLHVELSQILAGAVDNPQVDTIVALIEDKVLPNSNRRIVREEIFQRLGVTSEGDLYPAPPEFEKLDNPISRKQYEILLDHILNSTTPTIIQAISGVGKSVFARQITQLLPTGSLGIIYDCFGGGQYLNRSKLRHRHRDALTQIANEIAAYGFAESLPLIAQASALDDEILRKFLTRLDTAIKSLRKADKNAVLVIVIDAADNAEMAAGKFNDSCFVHELLRESLPGGCKLVMLCRPERLHLLQAPANIVPLNLEPFSREESLIHLQRYFPQATEADGLEFHRLTNNGNPRVQANALSQRFDTVPETLASFGPSGTTVEEQIEKQLHSAILSVKDKLPPDYQKHVDAICLGLANLPPFVPLDVLAKTAGVDDATIKSFIADLGRPLWLSDSSVQFRDEPTETWFRKKFSATSEQIASYITYLKPLASHSTYVAQALPSLLLQAEKYDELINLAISDEFLPENNPIDARNVRVYRLQFAFKAALKLKQYADAAKLALRAGEEVAGDKRQLALLKKNVDLIAPLQSQQKVQELAFRHSLRGGWDGSENVYSAALLSSVEDFKGEARSYLRAAHNWLTMYFEARERKEKIHSQDRLSDEDIVEMAFAHFNLQGRNELVKFLLGWNHPEVTYRISQKFIKRLVDAGSFDVIEGISELDFDDKSDKHIQYLVIAISHELLEVGRFLSAEKLMQSCLNMLADKHIRISKPDHLYGDTTLRAILSFLEGCAAAKLSKTKILRALNYYAPKRAARWIASRFQSDDRDSFLRATALRYVLENKSELNLDELFPIEFGKKGHKPYDSDQNVREFREVVGGLLPWYLVRAHVLVGNINDIANMLKNANLQSKNARTQRWRDSDTIHNEISKVQVEILILYRESSPDQVESFFKEYLKENDRIWMPDRFKAVRGAFRSNHLLGIRRPLEQLTYQIISSLTKEDSTTRAEWYICLARAVLSIDIEDAAVYFDKGVEAVSKFGDELIERWEAVVALAKRSAEGGHTSPELAYRFIRCAELVGDNAVDEDHFNRKQAIRICAKLSPTSALAALSRWRDRDVGWFDRQLPALAYEMVHSDYLSPSTGWPLSAFFDGSELDDFASLCLKKSSVTAHSQYILETAIRDLRLYEASEKIWRNMDQVAQQYGIRNTQLNEILAFYTEYPEKDYKEINKPVPHLSQGESEQIDWDKLLSDLDLTTASGISQAIHRFDITSTKFRDHKAFWQEVFKRIQESDAVKFLQALVIAEHADKFDIRSALLSLPDDWRQKASVKRNWEQFLESVARRFASEFMSRFIWENYQEAIRPDDDIMPAIRKGILEGLSQEGDLVDASTLFGFAEVVSPYISPEEGTSLLDYALSRFELHTEAEYADGPWASWLNPPEEISTALAGFIWSALGSPRMKIRWQAAHCVRRLAEMGCEREIDALIRWLESDTVGAFGNHKFPFYNLHARQYLLIALARVSVDNPQILKNHSAIFPKYAFSTPHILIQKFSTEIALNIEKIFPGTYDGDVLAQFHQVGKSQLPIRNTKNYHGKFESYWHAKGEVDTTLKFYHGWDFDRYWFEPLGEVFGISKEQVEELATEVLVNEWRVNTDGSFQNDPRSGLWHSSQNERETWHDHGSYPRTDNYGFYLSYHSMLVVAAKLLEKMPVLHRRDWEEDEWTEWLERHELTRKDGRWLSDRRDPAPLLQRAWIREMKDKNWRSDISSIDFLDGILFERSGETWLNVYGFWEDGDSSHEEGFLVYTALVAPNVSQSLLNALVTSDPYDVKLPDYGEKDWELGSYPFELKGWIWDSNSKSGLDEFDPHGSRIAYPPYNIGQSIVEKLNLSVDSEQREWFLSDMEKPSLMCEIWRGNLYNDDKDPLRRGKRLNASLAFLRHLCSTLNRDLVFKVEIDRRFKETSYARRSDEDDTGYKPPHIKIYILSADGRLRDTETHYQLG